MHEMLSLARQSRTKLAKKIGYLRIYTMQLTWGVVNIMLVVECPKLLGGGRLRV